MFNKSLNPVAGEDFPHGKSIAATGLTLSFANDRAHGQFLFFVSQDAAMEVDEKWYNRFRAAIVLSTVPSTFLAVLFAWGFYLNWMNHSAVSAFIDKHADVIARESKDSRVHRFAISIDPEYSGRLLIEIDVDDKETYFKLENSVPDYTELNVYPRFITRVRSGEDLGTDLGAVAVGAGLAVSGFVDALFPLLVAGALSVFVFIFALCISRRTAPLSG